jgi:hypothetical protein
LDLVVFDVGQDLQVRDCGDGCVPSF